MVRKLVFKLPLRRCECGGKPELCRYVWVPDEKQNGWYISCQRFICNRMVTKIYKSPLKTIIMWNLKDWKFSGRKYISNAQLKQRFLEKLYFKKTKGEK